MKPVLPLGAMLCCANIAKMEPKMGESPTPETTAPVQSSAEDAPSAALSRMRTCPTQSTGAKPKMSLVGEM